MRKSVIAVYSLLMVCICCSTLPSYAQGARAPREFYVDGNKGSDDNDARSASSPYKSLERLKGQRYVAGDRILLRRGAQYEGELFLVNIDATSDNPVVVCDYGDSKEAKPLINAAGNLAGVRIYDSSGVVVENIAITADGAAGGKDWTARQERISLSKTGTRCGVYMKSTKSKAFSDITLRGVDIFDIFLNEKGFVRNKKDVHSANGTGGYGFGILLNADTKESSFSDVLIEECSVENVAHTGIRFSGRNYSFLNVEIVDTKVTRVGGPGIQMSGVDGGVLRRCIIDKSGSDDDSRKWGRGSGYWCWSSEDILVEHCKLLNSNGPADSSGAHIDFNCNNVLYQYNLSMNNAGSFVEILGENYNCIYRYNVSVNDGWRVNGDRTGAAQEVAHQWGYTIWLSNWSMTKKGPYNSYIYNNTIYVDSQNVSRNTFAETAEGVCIINNIFHIEGKAEAIKTSWNNSYDEAPKKGEVWFNNNLFLTESSWAEDSTISDGTPIYGDVQFKKGGGITIADYTPKNTKLVKNRGVEIVPLPETKIPMRIELKVKHDILGNKIKGAPDMGAIEIK